MKTGERAPPPQIGLESATDVLAIAVKCLRFTPFDEELSKKTAKWLAEMSPVPPDALFSALEEIWGTRQQKLRKMTADAVFSLALSSLESEKIIGVLLEIAIECEEEWKNGKYNFGTSGQNPQRT